MKAVDLSKTPNYITLKALVNHPERIFSSGEDILSRMKIDVNQTFVDDKELFDTVVDGTIEILNEMHDLLVRDFAGDGPMMFKNMVSTVSISYSA